MARPLFLLRNLRWCLATGILSSTLVSVRAASGGDVGATSMVSWAPWCVAGLGLAVAGGWVAWGRRKLRRQADALRSAEAQLSAAETRWRFTLMGLHAGIWDYDFVTEQTLVSAHWQEMLGYAGTERVNSREDFWPRIHPDDVKAVKQRMRDYLAGNSTSYSADFRMRCKDGHYKWIRSCGVAQFSTSGEPIRMVGSHTDIDEQKRSEDLLRTSEERYRVLFENSPLAIVEYDLRGLRAWLADLRAQGVTDFKAYAAASPNVFKQMLNGVVLVGANQESVRLVGAANKAEAIAAMSRLVTGDIEQVRRELCRALWDGEMAMQGEVQLKALDGSPRRLFYRWWVPTLGGEANYACTQVVLLDLTDIKRTEEALTVERERLSVTLRSMAEGVITTDMQGRVRFMNEAAYELTGWSEAAAIGRRLAEVCVLRNDKTRQALPSFEGAVGGDQSVVDLPVQTALFDRSGARHLVEGRYAKIQGGSSQSMGAVLVLRDVSERARLEGEVMRASRLESVGILAGGIAHDFNNLLTVVMGNITLVMLDQQAMAATGRWLQEAERAVMRARDLTQQLLTFARGGEPVRSAVNLPDVIQEAAHFALHGSKVRAEFTIEPKLWTADVDKGQVGQVIQNLVINAVQAMPEGGLVRIALSNQRLGPTTVAQLGAGDYLCVTLSDTGQGIPHEHLTHIFDPYFTTKKTGNGLGLAMVYSIIRRHGGHIEVESELARGTCFRFWLPAVPGAVPSSDELPFTPQNYTGRVLFMDDEESIRQMAEVLLSRLGFQVQLAADGQEAVTHYGAALRSPQPFDLVIMDITVPGGMGGKEAMAELCKLDPAAKGIVSSGYSSDPVMANFRTYGFSGWVAKPYRLTELAKTIRAVMDGTEL